MAHKQINTASHLPVGKHPDHPSHPALSSGRVGYAREPSDSRAGGFSATMWRVLLPPALWAVAVVLAVTAMAAVSAGSADPAALVPLLAPVATAIASLLGGITAGLCHRRRSVSAALLYGGLLTVILCLVGLTAEQGGAVTWLTRLMPLPLHALGGVITRPRPPKAAHRRT